MAETSADIIRRYLEDAIAAEKSFEAQLEAFSREGDDDEVKAAFAAYVIETRRSHERLTARLKELGGGASMAKSFFAQILGLTPKPAQVGHGEDERTVQNLIAVFAIANSECAMYEVLATMAQAASDPATESLAREIQAQGKEAAEKVWRFIPSRAKIAFNLLTVTETDPAVSTKAADNRLL